MYTIYIYKYSIYILYLSSVLISTINIYLFIEPIVLYDDTFCCSNHRRVLPLWISHTYIRVGAQNTTSLALSVWLCGNWRAINKPPGRTTTPDDRISQVTETDTEICDKTRATPLGARSASPLSWDSRESPNIVRVRCAALPWASGQVRDFMVEFSLKAFIDLVIAASHVYVQLNGLRNIETILCQMEIRHTNNLHAQWAIYMYSTFVVLS